MMYLAFRTAYFVRFQMNLQIFQLDVRPPVQFYHNLFFLLTPIWVVIFAVLGLYNRQKLLGGTEEYARVFRATTTGMFVVIIAGFLQPEFIIARGWLIMAWFLAFVYTSAGRFFLRRCVYGLRKRGYFLSMALIVGVNAEGCSLAEQLQRWKTSGLYVVGFVDSPSEMPGPTPHLPKFLGPLERIDDIIAQYSVEELIIAPSALTRDKILDIFNRYGVSSDVNLRMSSGLYEIITTGLQVNEIADVPLVKVNKVRLTGVDQFLKQFVDYTIAVLGLCVTLPLMLVLAILIKWDSPGPVFHRRRVLGVNGRQFDAYKFRTMVVNGDELLSGFPELQEELSHNHKLKDDPRVTRMGKFLRKYSLDEIPQLLNVLKREMSIVGPRMITPDEMKHYNHWALNLLTVRPGITGLWQVSGRSDISYEHRVRLDMQYIRNWSFLLELQILFRTIPVVLRGKGAY